ncbi:hypothetical protein [Pseudonocardia sp. GCM10023141]|uniref:hypothetical protein n=1 Tax=Pseudonocardia sp. GCM10023141 TaxID=3252653 RepID=UPI00360A3404
MTAPPTPTSAAGALRSARLIRAISQSDAAREIAALGHGREVPVAAAASLKTLLSRWENGHAVPEPQYRELLCELYQRTPAELGFAEEAPAAGGLRAGIAAAAAVGDTTLELWWEQLAVARRLDDELGAAGAAGVVHALVEQLATTLVHTVAAERRPGVARVLAAAAALAGHQSLDGAHHEQAWLRFDQSRAAATVAVAPAAEAEAATGLAAVLVDAGEPQAALTLLAAAPPPGPVAHIRWEAARGTAQAAIGDAERSRAAFSAAGLVLPGAIEVGAIEVVEPPATPVELADLHRWHGSALVAIGDHEAGARLLERSLAARPASIRHRAALHTELAVALRRSDPASATGHRREARELATRIGAKRLEARLTGAERPPAHDREGTRAR